MDFSNLGDTEGHSDEGEMHFYYDRKERIAHAPKIVQDYYSGKFRPSGGIFKSLVSTTGNKLLLICVLICAAAVVVLNKTGDKTYRKHIGQAVMQAASFSYGDDVYVSVKAVEAAKANGDKDVVSSKSFVEGKFTAVDARGNVISQANAEDVMLDGKAEIRMRFSDYGIKKVLIEVTYKGDTKTLITEVGKNE